MYKDPQSREARVAGMLLVEKDKRRLGGNGGVRWGRRSGGKDAHV